MQHNQSIRYGRTISLCEIGEAGQEKLLNAKVLVVGAGGLGCPVLLYLAACGVGNLGIIDGDMVDLSNLQRQILFETTDIGQPKVEAAQQSLHDLNPDVNIHCYNRRIDKTNAREIIANYDIIADCSDNFATRFLLNDRSMELGKTLVSAAIYQFEGQLYTFKQGGVCYRCIYGDIPPEETAPTCAESGILGSVAGTMGTLQATEIVKEIVGIGSLSGYMLRYDALAATTHKVKINRDSECFCCG